MKPQRSDLVLEVTHCHCLRGWEASRRVWLRSLEEELDSAF